LFCQAVQSHIAAVITDTHARMHIRLMALLRDYPGEPVPERQKPILDFTEARHSEWQWHQLGSIQVYLAPDR